MESKRPVHRLLMRVQRLALEHPGRVLSASLLALAVAIFLGSGVEFRTSRSDLAPANDPDQRRLDQVAAEFTGTSDLVACVEAAPGSSRSPEELRAFADLLAERFRAEPEVAGVFHKVDLGWFAERAFFFLPPDTVREGLDALAGGALDTIAEVRDLSALNETIASRIESDLTGRAAPREESARRGIESLTALLEWERRFLEKPSVLLDWLEEKPPLIRLAGERPGLESGGYLQTHDAATLFLMVSSHSDDDSLPYLRRFVGSLRQASADILAAHDGFQVAFTGAPAMTVEEMQWIRIDTWTTAAVASAGVILLTFLVFRWRTHALLALSALLLGVVWALGAVRLELGYLNLITSSFISTLVGVGVAYAIHPVSEYELQGAHTRNPREAVRAAYHATGAAVTTGAVTTAGAFFAILFMEFRGFAELGLVAGVGVILCLIAALVTLPAILVLHGRWRNARDRSTRAGRAVDRIWVERGADHVCSHPRITAAVALLLTVSLAWLGTGVRFDTSLIELLPEGAESARYLRRMIEDSDLSPNFNIILTDDLEELRDLRARASDEPTIARFDSVLSFLPEDPEGSRAVRARAAEALDEVTLPAEPRPLDREELLASLRRLEDALSAAAEAAFGSGLAGLAGPLEHARVGVEDIERVVKDAPRSLEEDWNEGQKRLLEWTRRLLDDLRAAARAEPPDPDHLPGGIRERFVTRSGQFVSLLHSTESIFDAGFLDEFVAASRRVSTDVTGFPIIFDIMSERIVSGFYRAAGIAAVIVFLILLIDLRSVRESVLALVPLAIGLISMMGSMRLLGIPYNFANLVAVPLIIGVGIDNGVHIIHRLRLEGDRGMTVVLRHTGRAILISSLTTLIGFGSLSLATHRGLASLGIILILGVASCLVASMIFLPSILIVLGRARR